MKPVLPPRLLAAVVAAMQAKGRDFDTHPLLPEEARAALNLWLCGYPPAAVAQGVGGEQIVVADSFIRNEEL